jgi:hypothetical protein
MTSDVVVIARIKATKQSTKRQTVWIAAPWFILNARPRAVEGLAMTIQGKVTAP